MAKKAKPKKKQDHPQSGTEAPRRDARDTVGGGPLGDNKPIGDPGTK